MAENRSENPRHPIQLASRRTGLTAAVIRAWERRYEAIRPSRSATRRRLYSDAEIEKLGTSVGELQTAVADYCENTATKAELVAHSEECPAREGKRNGWALAQQRLGVIVSIVVILGAVVGAWIWSVRAFNAVESRVERGDKAQQRDRREMKRSVRQLLKAIKEDKNDTGGGPWE